MTTKSPPWFRFYSEVLSDRKIQRICHLTKKPKALVVGVWATILAMASDSPERGVLLISEGIAVTLDDISLETGLSPEECGEIIAAFIAANMVHSDDDTFIVTQWDSRQYKSDTSNDRVAKYRDKKRDEEGKPPKRQYNKKCNVTVTPPETDTDTESDINQVVIEKAAEPKKRHPDFNKVCTEYQQEIGGLSGVVSDTIDDDLKIYPADWIIEAMKRAALSNNRRYSYVQGILRNWKASGGPQNDTPKSGRLAKNDTVRSGYTNGKRPAKDNRPDIEKRNGQGYSQDEWQRLLRGESVAQSGSTSP